MGDKLIGRIKYLRRWLLVAKYGIKHYVDQGTLLLVVTTHVCTARAVKLEDGKRFPAHTIRFSVKKLDHQLCRTYSLPGKKWDKFHLWVLNHPLKSGIRNAIERAVASNKEASAG